MKVECSKLPVYIVKEFIAPCNEMRLVKIVILYEVLLWNICGNIYKVTLVVGYRLICLYM